MSLVSLLVILELHTLSEKVWKAIREKTTRLRFLFTYSEKQKFNGQLLSMMPHKFTDNVKYHIHSLNFQAQNLNNLLDVSNIIESKVDREIPIRITISTQRLKRVLLFMKR